MQRRGRRRGWLCTLIMPRVFAHAHLAALDTFLSLFWALALLAGDRAVQSERPILAMAAAGMLWALALLTKIHAWFLLPILGVWSLVWLSPRRAVLAMLAWTAVGVCLFWLGWPWLWYDSWNRLQAFWGTGVVRSTIMVQYFGQVLADRDVPWHYPWFYFAATVPSGLLALGTVGIVRGWKNRQADPLPLLLAGTIVVFLVIFSTRVPVYDGERLFLHVFPAWALLIGLGFGWLWDKRLTSHRGRAALLVFLVAQSHGVIALHPFGLSYYNGLVGGLPGADRLGLELTYWNDPVDQVLLDQLAGDAKAGASAALVPTVYPGQGILTTKRAGTAWNIILSDEQEGRQSEWLVIFASYRVLAAGDQRATSEKERAGQVAVRTRQGVWLAALWHFAPTNTAHPSSTIGEGPTHPSRGAAQNSGNKPFP